MDLFKRFLLIAGILVVSLWVFFTRPFNLGLDLKGGISIVLDAQEVDGRQITNDDMIGVIDVINGRINALGLTEPIIQRKGLKQLLELPGINDIDRAIKLIGETAQLTFHEAQWVPQNIDQLTDEQKTLLLGEDADIVYLEQFLSSGEYVRRPLVLKKKVLQGISCKKCTLDLIRMVVPLLISCLIMKPKKYFTKLQKKMLVNPLLFC